MTLDDLRFDERGLIPAVVQEADTGELLMVAWMDRAALAATLQHGRSHFWSRSRQTLWEKGETSGHRQHVEGVFVDCDGDTLLLQVHQEGVACHTGHRTCFFRTIERGDDAPAIVDRVPAANLLERLEAVIAARKAAPPPDSYVAGLLQKGETEICRKLGEEAVEVITAALGGEGDRRVLEEVADLWFHTIVLLGQRDLSLRAVLEELARREAGRRADSS
jgi:phosphoribosyl-ATP pyrophosphohydrolase/phosphoribosyl-AMP cyclohydrolase